MCVSAARGPRMPRLLVELARLNATVLSGHRT
jgi:hypothetical protein